MASGMMRQATRRYSSSSLMWLSLRSRASWPVMATMVDLHSCNYWRAATPLPAPLAGFSADADQFFLEGLAFADVLGGVALHAGDGLRAQFTHHLGRGPQNQ
ncbi:hypothetical protein D3C72_677450 [compost metagenome]